MADAFLDTIPEDKSVEAARVANLSTASAVASSDDSEEETNNGKKKQKKKKPKQKKKQKKKERKPPRAAGAYHDDGEGDDAVSDTPALLGEHADQGPLPPDEEACAKRTYVFYSTMSVVLIAVAIGVYFVIQGIGSSSDLSPEVPSSQETTIAPFFLDIDTEAPSASPSYNPEDRQGLDDALLQISVDDGRILDIETPQGKCRYWLTHNDRLQLKVDQVGSARIQQRYIMCLLYYATNGDQWTLSSSSSSSSFLDEFSHECDWTGTFCDTEDRVAVLDLSESNLVGSLPEEIRHLEDLQALSLYRNSLTGSLPSDLFSVTTKLFSVDMSSNDLTGMIPNPNNAPLDSLYLYDNLFTGIHDGYATMQSLTKLIVFNNTISGTLPRVWNAPQLVDLDMALNFWTTGTIPDSIWELPKLETLGLHDSFLTGKLPSTVATRGTALRHVWLHSNDLSGTIPSTFGENWENFASLKLQNNQFTGTIPCTQPQLERLDILEVDCDLQCSSCCTDCF